MTLPFVSVIMPVRNEAAYIDRSLGSVLAQDYPIHRMELIVVDGMSVDGTRERVREMTADSRMPVKVLDNPARIVPTGLNLAVREAKGEIIVRVDGHCKIPANYISCCVRHLSNEGVDGVGGVIETIGETLMAQVISAAMSSPFGVGDSAFRTGNVKTDLVDTIPFPAYTRRVMQTAGLYDEELVRNQDDEYNYRLRKIGAKLLLADDVTSKYYSRSSLKSLWRQYFQYGFWKVRVLQKHPKQMRLRQFIPATFVALLVVLLGMSTAYSSIWLLGLVTLTGLYLMVNMLFSFGLAAKKGWRYLLLLPIVFAVLHIAYGLGFLIGLMRFIHRWRDGQGRVPSLGVVDAGSA